MGQGTVLTARPPTVTTGPTVALPTRTSMSKQMGITTGVLVVTGMETLRKSSPGAYM